MKGADVAHHIPPMSWARRGEGPTSILTIRGKGMMLTASPLRRIMRRALGKCKQGDWLRLRETAPPPADHHITDLGRQVVRCLPRVLIPALTLALCVAGAAVCLCCWHRGKPLANNVVLYF